MARRPFGGTPSDVVQDARGNARQRATGTAWTAQVGGTQITDLAAPDGTLLPDGVITAGQRGEVQYLGPDDDRAALWADFGNGRFLMLATDAPSRLDDHDERLVTVEDALPSLAVSADVVPLTQKGVADGVATLDSGGHLPDAQIPSTIARDTEVAAAVAALVNSAPGILDTLGELATQMQSDESAAAALATLVASKAPLASPALTGTPTVAGQPVETTTHAAVTYQPLVYERYGRALPLAQMDRRLGRTVMTTPPTVTVQADNAQTGFITNPREYLASTGTLGATTATLGISPTRPASALSGDTPPSVRMKGGQPALVAGGGRTWLQPYLTNLAGSSAPTPWTLEVAHYGTQIAFGVRASSYTNLLFKVDGQFVSLTPTQPGTSTALRYVLLDFTSAGGAALRHIEVYGAMHFFGIEVGPTDTLALVDRPTMPRWYTAGDSFFGGTGATYTHTGLVQTAMQRLGIDDYQVDALGSTGFLKTSGSSTNYLTRLQYALPTYGRCDGFLLCGSINDAGSYTQSQIEAGADAVFDYIATLYPNAPVVVPVFASSVPTPAAQSAALAGFQAAAADRSNVYVLNLQDTLSGTGLVGATTGVGNADIFRGSDGSHPTQAGHDFYGDKIARMIQAVLPAYAA